MRNCRALVLAAFLPIAACGGGGGGGGTVKTPAPTPTPPPISSPSPTPTPQNARFTVEAAGAVPGTLWLFVGEDPNVQTLGGAQFFTDLSGSLLVGTTSSPYGGGGQTANFPGFDYSANYALKAWGAENPTRLVQNFTAPRKATTASPLTSLIQGVGNQAAVKNALGLGTVSTFLLPADLDLTTYSATRDLASGTPQSKPGQVLSANVRVLALQQAVEVFGAAPGTPSQYGMDNSDALTANARIAAYIKATPSASLATADGVAEFLHSLRAGASTVYRDDVYQAAAALIRNFDLATRIIDDNPSFAPRFSSAVMGSLRPRLDDLAEQNSAAAAAAAGVASNFLMDEASRFFTDQLPFPTGSFLPIPDFFRMPASGQLTIFKDNTPVSAGGAAGTPRPNMTSNDRLWANSNFQLNRPATIRSISVPASSSSAIEAVLQPDGSVVVTGKAGFSGIAWYDYVTALDTGPVETGRVYLFIR